ncbi:hypothetical protein [Desulfonatronospira sp.]|uniref:hypothetical protein n=1 Tax=Desulfonatronospira sp. TaxID=1962951 RepID=UPI0025BE6509|nr:hypothetical protein [Desulfonatronospira sp.]
MSDVRTWYVYWLSRITAGLVFIALLSLGCAPSIALYSERAYDQAVTLKASSLRLMDRAVEPYNDHEQSIESLLFEMDKAYEYARGRPANELSTRQWEILRDPDRHLLGGFIRRWEEQETLSPFFISEAKEQVGHAFDTVIGLESGKIRPSEVN